MCQKKYEVCNLSNETTGNVVFDMATPEMWDLEWQQVNM